MKKIIYTFVVSALCTLFTTANAETVKEKYDFNDDGVLGAFERHKLKHDAHVKFHKKRHAVIVRNNDNNGDGKLDAEERKEMRAEHGVKPLVKKRHVIRHRIHRHHKRW